jgi:hypothetical protein
LRVELRFAGQAENMHRSSPHRPLGTFLVCRMGRVLGHIGRACEGAASPALFGGYGRAGGKPSSPCKAGLSRRTMSDG